MEAGIDDVSLGVLFGLELYRYEFAALLMHAEHLEAIYGVGPHAISVPRIKKQMTLTRLHLIMALMMILLQKLPHVLELQFHIPE